MNVVRSRLAALCTLQPPRSCGRAAAGTAHYQCVCVRVLPPLGLASYLMTCGVVCCPVPSLLATGAVAELPSLQAAFARSASLRHDRQRFFRGSHSDEPKLRTFVVYRRPSLQRNGEMRSCAQAIPKIAATAHMYGLAGNIQRETGTTKLPYLAHARDGTANSGTQQHVGRAGDDEAALRSPLGAGMLAFERK